MKYFEVEFTISPYSADASDLLAALAGEAGFETFEETETGLKGYVQQELFSEETLKTAMEDFPFDNVAIGYEIREAEDRDWNEQWEQEGFEPIVVRGEWRKATGRRALLGNEIIAPAITKTDKDRRLRTLDDEVRDIDIFQCASVDNLQLYSRRAYTLTEEFLLLVAAVLHYDAADVNVTEADVSLSTQLDGIAVA